MLTALGQDALASVHLYVGVRDESDLYGDDEFGALAAQHPHFHFVPVLSAPSGPTPRRTGMVHEAVAADFSRLDDHVVHIAGPVAMVEATKALALQRGAASKAVLADPFQPHGEDGGGGLLRAVFAFGSSLRRKAGQRENSASLRSPSS